MHARSRLIALVACAPLALTTVVATASSASATDVSCGSVLTTSTTLTHDLVCDGTTDGLVIAADDVVLDLNGFTVSGPGAYSTPYAGVRVTQRSRVTITKGTLTGWQAGVVLNEAWDGRVSKATASANDQGINIAGGGRHVIEKNTSTLNGRDAIRLGLSTGNLVTQNTVSDNTFGIMVADFSSSNTVSRNVVTGTRSVGVSAFGGAVATTFSQNQVSGSWDDGIRTSTDSSGSVISQNTSSFNGGDGIEAANAIVSRNLTLSNGQYGIRAVVGVVDGGGNKAAGNGEPAQCLGVTCSTP